MNCPHCHGTGRDVGKVHRCVNGKTESMDAIFGQCPHCHGQRIIHCCEGDRAEAMIAVGEMADGTCLELEVNPNEL